MGSAASVGKLKRRGTLLFLFRSTPTASKSGLDWRPIAFRPAIWTRGRAQLPSYARVDTWQRAIEDEGRFLDLWGTEAAAMRWTAGELFDVPRDGRPGGLVWQLKGERVGTLGEDRARLTHGRMIKRQVRT